MMVSRRELLSRRRLEVLRLTLLGKPSGRGLRASWLRVRSIANLCVRVVLCALVLALNSWTVVQAQEGCDGMAINDRMDGLIAAYLTERTRDALGAAWDLQAGIEALVDACSLDDEQTLNAAVEVRIVGPPTLTEQSNAPTPTVTRTPVPATPTVTPTPTPWDVVAAAAQGDVVPAGEAGDTGQGFTVRVTGLVRPANNVIASQSPFNPAPGSGEEYVVVAVTVECPTTCDVDYFDFALTGDSGTVYSSARVYYRGRLNVRGTGGSGDLPFLIRADETNLWLLYLADRLNNVTVTYEVGGPRGTLTAETLPAAGVTSTPEGGVEVIASTNLNVREGPGTQFRIAGSVRTGTALVAYGRNEDGTWLRVVQGWVFAELVTTEADVESLPVVDQ